MYSGPAGVAYDSTNGILYISDNNNHRIVKVTASTGAFVGAIGSSTASTGSCPAGAAAPGWCTGGTFALGNGDGMYRLPRDITVDGANDALYFADGTNHRIIKVTASTGAFVGMIGEMFASTGTCPNGGIAAGWCTGGLPIAGSADGSFNQTRGVAIDTAGGYLYVTDQNNHKISKILASTGAFVGAVGRTSATAGTCPAAGATTGWCTGGTFTTGAADGMYNTLNGLMVDSANNALFAADLSNHRIARINLATGVFVGAIGNTSASTGTCPTTGAASIWCTGGTFASAASDGAFSGPGGLSIDLLTGYLYVSDSGNSRIVRVR
jgi:DNA-binding beta-propeller fold protein YncE